MYKNAPKFTTEQELATRYWWNITQLAAVAVQDVFLIVYTAMEDTDNGTKSIARYCLQHRKDHVMKELKGEGYDMEKLNANPKDVFFDLQLTRKVMDKVLVEYENKDIIIKMRKKIRWLVYQRNDVCHEMLQPLEITQLKLKLGSLKGVLRQLYNLASQYAKMDKGETDSALACFLEELEEHRLLVLATEEKFKRRNFKRRFRKKSSPNDGESSEDIDKTEDDSEKEDSLYSSEKDDSTDNSQYSERRDSRDTTIWPDKRNISETTTEMLPEDENVLRENEKNWGINKSNGSCNYSQSFYSAEGSLNTTHGSRNVCNTEGDFQELWRVQGSTVMVQVGLYCSKGFPNQFGSIQTKLQSADQLMIFWQRCLCELHEKFENTPRRYFVPPKISIRTRSKSLGRKAAQYLLKYQRMRRRKYKTKKGQLKQGKQSLGSILDDVRIPMPEIQKGVFGNQWEDMIRREEAIVAIENWETLTAEDEWENEWWVDFDDLNTLGNPCFKSQTTTDSRLQSKNVLKGIAQKSGDVIVDTRCNFCRKNCDSYVFTQTVAPESKISPTIPFIAVSILSLLLFSLVTFLIFITTFLFAVALGRVITELLNVFVVISIIFSLGSSVTLIFVIVAFMHFALETIHKILKVLRFFITYCYMLEKQSARRLGKTYYVVRE